MIFFSVYLLFLFFWGWAKKSILHLKINILLSVASNLATLSRKSFKDQCFFWQWLWLTSGSPRSCSLLKWFKDPAQTFNFVNTYLSWDFNALWLSITITKNHISTIALRTDGRTGKQSVLLKMINKWIILFLYFIWQFLTKEFLSIIINIDIYLISKSINLMKFSF